MKTLVVPVSHDIKGEKRKVDGSKDVIEMLQMVKKFCSDERYKDNKVVVEIVENSDPSLSSLTGISSQQGSPRALTATVTMETDPVTPTSEPEQITSDSGFLSDSTSRVTRSSLKKGKKNVAKDIVDSVAKESVDTSEDVSNDEVTVHSEDADNEVDETDKTPAFTGALTRQRTQSVAESAHALLSLLKNPNDSSVGQPVQEVTPEIEVSPEVVDTTDHKDKGKKQPKSKGISSSLLAVIEQLRERSREDGEESVGKRTKK